MMSKMWLSANKLKLNPDQMEVIIFGQRGNVKNSRNFPQSQFFTNFLSPAEVIRNLGIWFETDVFFSRHIQNTCKTCFVQIWVLTYDAAFMAANASGGSRLD